MKKLLFLKIIFIFVQNMIFSLTMPVTLHVMHQLWLATISSILIKCCFFWMIRRGLLFPFPLHLPLPIHHETSLTTSLPTLGHFYAMRPSWHAHATRFPIQFHRVKNDFFKNRTVDDASPLHQIFLQLRLAFCLTVQIIVRTGCGSVGP